MKRLLWGIAVALGLSLGAGQLSQARTNNFTISSYTIDYRLGIDDSSRSTLRTVETITAEFPQSDQNHGLERAIPIQYNGHSTSLSVLSVADENGKKLQYSTSTSNGNKVLRIGDAERYVHGRTTYVITYTQRDVTRYFADTDKDEFYWDTNGTEWSVPIAQLDVRVHMDESVASRLTGDRACYQGAAGSSDRCKLRDNNGVVSTTLQALKPGQNATISLGFKANTFSSYQQSPAERLLQVLLSIWIIALIITSLAALVCFTILTRRYLRVSEREAELGTIVPEYLPPAGYGVLVSAQIARMPAKAFTAVLIDLAVRHYVKIYQMSEKSLFKQAQYELELVRSVKDLTAEERALVALLFPTGAIGSRFAMSSLTRNYTLGPAIAAATTTAVTASIKAEYGLRSKAVDEARWFKRFGAVTLIIGLVTLSPLLLALTSVMAFSYASMLRPLTDAGLELRRYLRGLKLYISVAEKERLKMLQSPEGVQKVGSGANEAGQLVKLYERVLPYAILFGQEKEWNKQLGAQYETVNNQPDWYSGTGAFNAVAFGVAMSSFSSTSSYATASSSSSGGSSGGGSSGGGGGGGGGGGW